MKRFLLGLSVSVLVMPVYAADQLDEISRKLAETPIQQAQFVQTRQLAALKTPFIIHGRMVFAREKGVIWQIEKPYKMGYIMTAKGVREVLPDGTFKERPAGNVPGIGSVEGLFKGILTADRQVLNQNFSAEIKGSNAAWSMVLTPKNSTLQKVLTEVMLNGGEQVKNIRIREVNGDDTTIRFSHIEPLKTLSNADSTLLNGK